MLLTEVDINGVDVTDYVVRYESESVYGEAIGQVEITLSKNANSLVTIETGQTVEIWRGFSTATDTKVFDGYVESYEPNAGLYKIVAKDKLWDLVRREVTKVYDYTIDASAGKISEIFKDLVTTYGELNADSGTIQDSGNTIIIQKFVCKHTNIFERCKRLAEAINWQFYYRADTDKVYFEPQGFTSNSGTLEVGVNVIRVPKWNYDNTEMVNYLRVEGASQEVETTETGQIGVTAGYTTTGITLTEVPVSVKVYGDASNPPTTLLTGGIPDSTSSFDYSVDAVNRQILPAPSTTFTTNDYYLVNYSYAVPVPIEIPNQASIDAYGKFEKTVNFSDIKNVADAEVRGSDFLAKYSTPFIYTTLLVVSSSDLSLVVGDKILVVDNVSPKTFNQELVVTRLRLRYPADYTEVEVGDKYWRLAEWQASIMEQIKRLQEENQQDSDLVVQIVNMDNTQNSPVEITPRYRKVLRQDVGGTNLFILGHPKYGILGTSKLGDTDLSDEEDHWIAQSNNTYSEDFTDTDFNDSTITNATWSGSGNVSFTAGQVAASTSIDYNNGTITTATLTADNSTNLVFSMAADGTNYELVTSGTPHTFTHTGTDLRWLAIATGSATLNSVEVSSYH